MKSEKVTNPSRRRYDDACATAHALELVGDRWALLILRELMFGPRRFSELRADLLGISANVLTQRLAEMEARGLVRKVRLPPPASVHVYEASEWGLEAEPLLQMLGRWAARSPLHDPTLPLSAVSLMMSLRTMIDPERAGKIDARIGFRMGSESFLVRLKNGGIRVTRGPVADCDLVFQAAPAELAAVIYGGQPLDGVRMTGSRALARRFVTLFPLPAKVSQQGH